jgi:hypothetical protein
MNLSHIREPNKKQIRAVSESQEQPRYEAHLRKIGRGRKHGFVLKPYLDNHERIFGETDLFKNLRSDNGKEKSTRN